MTSASVRASVFGLLLLVTAILYRQSYVSMVEAWLNSETYSHGFVIPLIALFFAWQRRGKAASVQAKIWWPGLALVAGVSAIWAISSLINVQVVEQFAAIAVISAIFVTLYGPQRTRALALPLAYLLFAVPFGQGLVPVFMEWTADFTVGALQLFGIPVIREGLYFSTSNGNFYVAEACSGVRYLLASVATGTAFAFVAYTDWKKRALFILAAIVTPIIANGIRAFGIVLIAHYSNMQLAVGIDHFIYGWFFFGIIMLLLFWIGSQFADHDVHEVFDRSGPSERQESEAGAWKTLAVGLLIAFVIGLGPALSESRHVEGYERSIYVPAGNTLGDGWVGPFATSSAWELGFVGATRNAAVAYRHGDVVVEFRAAIYDTQTQGSELVNFRNRLAGPDWQLENIDFSQVDRNLDSDFSATGVKRGAHEYIVLHWYQYGAERTTNGYRAKWLELKSLFKPVPAMVVAVGVDPRNENAVSVLTEFVDVGSSSITGCFLAHEPGPTCKSPKSLSDR